MMDLPVPDEVEGHDLKDSLLGKSNAKEPAGALMMGTGATAIFEDGHEWRAFRTKDYTYAQYLSDTSELLFNNKNDPLQMNNLIEVPVYVEIRKELQQRMLDEMKRIGDSFEPCSWYEKNWIKDRHIIKTATSDRRFV
jgi:arylsulfatase A-like enzyme